MLMRQRATFEQIWYFAVFRATCIALGDPVKGLSANSLIKYKVTRICSLPFMLTCWCVVVVQDGLWFLQQCPLANWRPPSSGRVSPPRVSDLLLSPQPLPCLQRDEWIGHWRYHWQQVDSVYWTCVSCQAVRWRVQLQRARGSGCGVLLLSGQGYAVRKAIHNGSFCMALAVRAVCLAAPRPQGPSRALSLGHVSDRRQEDAHGRRQRRERVSRRARESREHPQASAIGGYDEVHRIYEDACEQHWRVWVCVSIDRSHGSSF